MSKQITIKTPGKLMVAGEFAVLEPKKSLVVMAVNRFAYVTIAASETNTVSLINFDEHNIAWEYRDRRVQVDTDDPRISFVQEAMGVALLYLEELGVRVPTFSLTVKSELDDADSGLKYGLGSSAAVVTAVVGAILEYSLLANPKDLVIFKLASIAHVRIQGNGSGADIAASTFGGILHYKSFQAEWLLAVLQEESRMKRLVEMDWEYLSIERVKLPEELTLCVGWTGSPASTGSLVKQIAKLKGPGETAYDEFLRMSDAAVTNILVGMAENDPALFLKGIEENRVALARLGVAANVVIETDLLLKLSEMAKGLGGAGKLSGAGGGDCGIAYVQSSRGATLLRSMWQENGIKPLMLSVDEQGTERLEK